MELIPEPERCGSLEEAIQQLLLKSNIDEIITQALPKYKNNLINLKLIFINFLKEMENTQVDFQWTACIRTIKYLRDKRKLGGNYIMMRPSGPKLGETGNFVRRTNELRPLAAAIIFDDYDLMDIIPQKFVDLIVASKLPGLQWDRDHCDENDSYNELYLKTRRQLGELWLVSRYKSATRVIVERLTQLPSDEVEEVFQDRTFSKAILDFGKHIDRNGVKSIWSWPTLRSRLHEIKNTTDDIKVKELLEKRIHPEPSGGRGRFVTENRAMEWLGSLFGGGRDCMTRSPREFELDRILAVEKPLLDVPVDPSNEEQCAAIRAASTEPLQGDNYSSYVHPDPEQMAPCVQHTLTEELAALKDEEALTVEKNPFISDALAIHSHIQIDL